MAVKTMVPQVKIIGVAAAASPAMYESLHAGEMVDSPLESTLAEGLSGSIYPETLAMVQQYVDDVVLVSEDDIRRAIKWALFQERQVVEGSGAVGLAALLAGKIQCWGKTVVVISGGNIAGQVLAPIVREDARDG